VLHVYLPPGYFQETRRRYPVIYYLHGYGGGAGAPTVPTSSQLRASFPLAVRLAFPRVFRRILTLDGLDGLIRRRRLAPFILVQPDASLHLPHLHGLRNVAGEPITKGSFYVDSPFTGRYGTYVFADVLNYLDRGYRTIAEKAGRALAGGSMGGYGALLGGILHPERFAAVAALSPSIASLNLLDITLVVPYLQRLIGREAGRKRGAEDLADILDTCDLVFAGDRRLLPSLRRDSEGRIVGRDAVAWERWASFDAGALAEGTPGAFSQTPLLLSCHEQDEFGFSGPCCRLSAVLEKLGVAHRLEIYSDPLAARLSPHTMGIAWRILDALRWCLESLRISG
jgi:pimeloyl-ACP methyl ester carboxylesterase